MKITLNAESKRIINLDDLPIVRKIITDYKEDTNTAADYISYAIKDCVKVIEATAVITKNQRIYNALSEDSRDLDIWIDATARTLDGFVIIGAYLTDIWNIDGKNNKEIEKHMYMRKFEEMRK